MALEVWNYIVVSTQQEADERIPAFLEVEPDHRELRVMPLWEELHLKDYLGVVTLQGKPGIERVLCAGDMEPDGHVCKAEWVRSLRVQCIRAGIPFTFVATGSHFVQGGREYVLPDPVVQKAQAQKSHWSYVPGGGLAEQIPYHTPEREDLFARLGRSNFRCRFSLGPKDRSYVSEKGLEALGIHARDFVLDRLAAENPKKDGRQTPMRGHPVFLAMHATGCCCRECLEKWHHIPAGKPLSPEEQTYVQEVLMDWIRRQMERETD